MAEYKRQHTVTKAYLRRFTVASAPNSLWQYAKLTGKCRQCSVKKATVSFYQYSIKRPDGSYDHTVEAYLAKIENAAVPLLDSLECRQNLTPAQRETIAAFIAVTFRRTRRMIGETHEFARHYAADSGRRRELGEAVARELKDKFPEDEIRSVVEDYVAGKILPLSDDELKAFQFDAWGSNMNQGVRIFNSMHWEIVKCKKEAGFFVTSDAPAVVRPLGDPEKKYRQFIAPASDDAELTFPLSSRYVLRGERRSIGEYSQAPKMRVQEINARVIRMADRYVFTGERNSKFEELFEQNRHLSPPALPTVQVKP